MPSYQKIDKTQPCIIIGRCAVSRKVLAAAVSRVDGWGAYIDAAKGESHAEEYDAIMRRGQKLTKGIAAAIFPQFNPDEYCA